MRGVGVILQLGNAANVDDLDYANLLVLSEVGTMGASVDVIERAKAQRAGRRAALSALWVEIESLEGALDATSENVAAVERLVGAVGGWRVVIREASAPAS